VSRVVVRRAALADLDAVSAIYDAEVLGTVATFDTEPRTPREARAWFDSHAGDAHPLFVAEVDGAVAGWASLTPWSPRGAYARTVEGSVFVDARFRGGRVGAALLAQLAEAAGRAGHRVVLGRIEARNEASRRMLARAGFRSVGVMHAVGEKFGRVLDVEIFELVIDAAPVVPASPRVR
jgi:phosphinothricin acetyltransferase